MSSDVPGAADIAADRSEPGGRDYGRFIEAVRSLQDHARAANAPAEVFTEAADALQRVCDLLTPFEADEGVSPSGRRRDLPTRGNVLPVPMTMRRMPDGRLAGTARFRRFHLGRNGAAHGGAIALLFDSVLGLTAAVATGGRGQRTAYLHVNYRRVVPVGEEIRVESQTTASEGRKIFVTARLSHGDVLLADADALFVKLEPGQP